MALAPTALLAALIVAAPSELTDDGPTMVPLPMVDDVIERALAQADRSREQNVGGSFTFRIERLTEKLDGDDRVKGSESLVYEVAPIEGTPFARMILKNGEPIDQKEQRAQAKKERKFREALAAGETSDDRDDVEFNSELMERYMTSIEGVTEDEGRPCWVLAFRPRAGKLPKRRRIDHALNASTGRILIDIASDEIVAFEFELLRKVRIWGGLIGSVSQATGRLARSEIAPGLWYPTSFDLSLNGRILFRSLHQRMTIRWLDFTPTAAADTEHAATISAATESNDGATVTDD